MGWGTPKWLPEMGGGGASADWSALKDTSMHPSSRGGFDAPPVDVDEPDESEADVMNEILSLVNQLVGKGPKLLDVNALLGHYASAKQQAHDLAAKQRGQIDQNRATAASQQQQAGSTAQAQQGKSQAELAQLVANNQQQQQQQDARYQQIATANKVEMGPEQIAQQQQSAQAMAQLGQAQQGAAATRTDVLNRSVGAAQTDVNARAQAAQGGLAENLWKAITGINSKEAQERMKLDLANQQMQQEYEDKKQRAMAELIMEANKSKAEANDPDKALIREGRILENEAKRRGLAKGEDIGKLPKNERQKAVLASVDKYDKDMKAPNSRARQAFEAIIGNASNIGDALTLLRDGPTSNKMKGIFAPKGKRALNPSVIETWLRDYFL